MRERLQQRLAELRTEFESGQQTLDQLETQATTVRQTLLRISGAIQVLEEELGEPHGNSSEQEDVTVTGSATASRRG